MTATSGIRSRTAASTSSISSKDYGPSDRDIRHKFNLFGFFELPYAPESQHARAVGVGAADHCVAARVERRRSRPQQRAQGQRVLQLRLAIDADVQGRERRLEIMPILEMFNTFNNANNINPLSTPALFDFSGFLRTGVGDPRQVQLAVKFLF